MTNELTEVLPALQDNGEWRWLRTTVLSRLEADTGARTVMIDVDTLSRREVDAICWLLNWKPGVAGQHRVQLHILERELIAKVTNGPGLRDTLAAIVDRPLVDQRAQRQQDRLDSQERNEQGHAALIEAIRHQPRLDDERKRLEALSPNPSLKVPADSKTKVTRWPLYRAVLLAAAELYRRQDLGLEVTAKDLGGTAWNNSKGWTYARHVSLTNLLGVPVDSVVKGADTELRLRGPLTWIADDVVADAQICWPWLGLPARGTELLGDVQMNARGILLVENIETFQRVCELDTVTNRWLCIYGGGYMNKGLIRFLSNHDLPIAAWGDLDADGIHIITKAAERCGRPIHAVGMDVQLWRNGKKRVQTEDQLVRGRKLAESLRTTAIPDLRELAAAIAQNGEGCEQETLHNQVLPTLAEKLAELE
jgi:Uncharacterized protein conserved in bacteria C-term(DUF2220)